MRFPPNEECVNKFVISLERIGPWDMQRHIGIAISSQQPQFLFPDLVETVPNATYFVHIESRIRENLPENLQHLTEVKIENWPHEYQAPFFIYPLTMKIEHYREDPTSSSKIPTNRFELMMNHIPVSRTILDLYPGGGFIYIPKAKIITYFMQFNLQERVCVVVSIHSSLILLLMKNQESFQTGSMSITYQQTNLSSRSSRMDIVDQ